MSVEAISAEIAALKDWDTTGFVSEGNRMSSRFEGERGRVERYGAGNFLKSISSSSLASPLSETQSVLWGKEFGGFGGFGGNSPKSPKSPLPQRKRAVDSKVSPFWVSPK